MIYDSRRTGDDLPPRKAGVASTLASFTEQIDTVRRALEGPECWADRAASAVIDDGGGSGSLTDGWWVEGGGGGTANENGNGNGVWCGVYLAESSVPGGGGWGLPRGGGGLEADGGMEADGDDGPVAFSPDDIDDDGDDDGDDDDDDGGDGGVALATSSSKKDGGGLVPSPVGSERDGGTPNTLFDTDTIPPTTTDDAIVVLRSLDKHRSITPGRTSGAMRAVVKSRPRAHVGDGSPSSSSPPRLVSTDSPDGGGYTVDVDVDGDGGDSAGEGNGAIDSRYGTGNIGITEGVTFSSASSIFFSNVARGADALDGPSAVRPIEDVFNTSS